MSSDHQPRTLLIAWKTSSGPWSTAKAAVKLAFPVVLAVMSGLLAGWVLGPANMIRCRARAAIGSALRHLRPPATYLAGFWPCEYVAASDGGLDSGALGEPGQLRAAVTGLHEKPFHMLSTVRTDRCNAPAISRLERPAATWASTSASRGVTPRAASRPVTRGASLRGRRGTGSPMARSAARHWTAKLGRPSCSKFDRAPRSHTVGSPHPSR